MHAAGPSAAGPLPPGPPPAALHPPPVDADDDGDDGLLQQEASRGRGGGGDEMGTGYASPVGSESSGRTGLVWHIPSRGSSIPSPGKMSGLSPQPRSPYHVQATGSLGGFGQ